MISTQDIIGVTQLAIMIITAFVCAATLLSMFVAYTNWKLGGDLKKEIESQKNELANMKKELENDRIKLKFNNNDILREIGKTYLNAAIRDLDARWLNTASHFVNLSLYYSFFWKYGIELNDEDLIYFNMVHGFIDGYEILNAEADKEASGFLRSLGNFIQYCKDTKKQEHLERAENLQKEFRRIFGEQNK